MAKLLGPRTNDTVVNIWLLIFRVSAGAFMLTHGIPKFLKLIEGNTQFADPFGLGETLSLVLAVFAEFLCSVLIILGIGTRLASIPLIVTMAVAAFQIHAADPFQRKEMALLYLIVFITILVFGGGRFELGRAFRGR
ncbi:DoxX family protein [uncultured Sunxiuqinia sp.]|jgi:putative oxidoreductase|uniref:DoxX family protein n=1 Tax=uncultured Sunxiuqinia sp. TaxID=1573825 RepID=UPI0030D8B5E2